LGGNDEVRKKHRIGPNKSLVLMRKIQVFLEQKCEQITNNYSTLIISYIESSWVPWQFAGFSANLKDAIHRVSTICPNASEISPEVTL
jgi:hypothetical protein